jgi:hypothetical protein
MNRNEYDFAIGQAKRVRSARLDDPASRVAFERDFCKPVDDARDHATPGQSDEVLSWAEYQRRLRKVA